MFKILLSIIAFSSCSISLPNLFEKLDRYLQVHTDLGYFSGSVLVAQKDRIILSKGYGMSNYEHNITNSPSIKFKLSSLAKPFTSLAIMQLQEKGFLQVTDTLAYYIPDFPNGDKIMIHHLLSHTSGIKNYTALADFHSFKRQPHSIIELIEHFKNLPLDFQPGTAYKFSNSNYVLLNYIISQVACMPFDEYIMQYILKRAGMSESGIEKQQTIVAQRASGYTIFNRELLNSDFIDSSVIIGLGSFYSTIEDMYLFNKALYSEKLANVQTLAALFTPYTYIGNPKDNIQYGYGWATIKYAGRTVKKHIGGIDGFSTAMYRFVEDEIFIIVLSNFQQVLAEPLSFDLAAIIFDQPYELPKKYSAITLDPKIYTQYVGHYAYKDLIYSISNKDNKLYFKQPDRPPYEILPLAIDEFFVLGLPISITFKKDTQGQIESLVTKAFGKERTLKKKI